MIDYLIINELQNHANIIPVIGRGQNLDLDEYVKIKAEIRENQRKYILDIFNVNESLKVKLYNKAEILHIR